ncbi:hypothetical protein EJV46_04665 [Roseococcus sp. SYP-B2431]|uniref:DUF6134 family protein n=1 Tax=Roseococcus sp. SYP-B2431 TaxID=2496640 RepID=UPI00103BD50D|nr:DUF6134 family protein [Roseococcus sp. SYP-B2431]TCH99957.1 hypothetical protein EJV46_04665 [Roseococcus sp. SYP-B2431]
MRTMLPAIPRRLFPMLAATPALAQPAPAPGPAGAGYRWRVMRNGTHIGSHEVSFSRRGADLLTLSEVVVTPRVLGVVVYRFEHRYMEVTREGRFVSVASRQNRNGRIVDVQAEATPRGVAIRGSEGERMLPAEAVPLSWWEPQRFGGAVPVFGTTTGRLMDLRWTREAIAGGGTRWRCAGEVDAVLDFSADGRWTAYQVTGDDGSTVMYERAG